MHSDHRSRVRKRFISGRIDSFPDHNILEMLLFYAIPRVDTNETAHRILSAFNGSLSAVFNASYAELTEVEGVGESAATLILLFRDLFDVYKDGRISNQNSIESPDDMKRLILKKSSGKTRECLWAIAFDTKYHVINCIELGNGEIDVEKIDFRALTHFTLRTRAKNIVLVHNTFSGFLTMSRIDAKIAHKASEVLSGIGINLKDYCIVLNNSKLISAAKEHKFKGLLFDFA